MGIRYHAFPVPAEVAETAASAPADYLRSFSRYAGEADGPEIEGETLNLDKAWHYLQRVLRGPADEPPRPAYELVHGDVEHTGMGWKPFVRVLTAQQVAVAATDLATVDSCEVTESLSRYARPDDGGGRDHHAEDVEYTLDYLHIAIDYLAELARRGHGLAYVIG